MAIVTEWVRYSSVGDTGYLAWPERASAPMPGLVVLQEAGGVNAHVEDVTRRFAAAGYVAFAPDLFAPGGERRAPLTNERLGELMQVFDGGPPNLFRDAAAREALMNKLEDAKRQRVIESFSAMMSSAQNLQSFVPQLLRAANYLRNEVVLTRGQKIGSVGFCMGGGLSALLSCEDPELGAAVVFYGSSPPADAVARGRCPVLGLYGELDERIIAQLPGFEEAMARAGRRFEVVRYEDAPHAFFNDGRASYRAGAARDAFARSLAFFRAEIG